VSDSANNGTDLEARKSPGCGLLALTFFAAPTGVSMILVGVLLAGELLLDLWLENSSFRKFFAPIGLALTLAVFVGPIIAWIAGPIVFFVNRHHCANTHRWRFYLIAGLLLGAIAAMFIVPYYAAIATETFGTPTFFIAIWFILAAGIGAFYAIGLRFALGVFDFTKLPVEQYE